MTTDEALEKLFSIRGMAKRLNMNVSTFGNLKHNHKTGKATVSLDKKIELLTKEGFVIEKDIDWKEPDELIDN
jgi:hypothetical protein